MCVCTVEIPLRTADIGEHVQGVSERGRFSGLRWNGDGFFETRARQIVLTHALEDLPAICQVAATDIIDFIRSQATRLRPPGLKCVVTAMRSFLRYGQYRGDVAGALVAAVPAVATWTTTPALPRAISPDHAQRAIDSCDVGTPIGLSSSGDPLDPGAAWTAGWRGHRATAGRLRLGPRSCSRSWQGRARVPAPRPTTWVEPLQPISVADRSAAIDTCSCARTRRSAASWTAGMPSGSIVKYALARAGIDAPHRGSHQFRHALAVRMLRGGASLAEIGEVLRHRSPQTTSIYARVDLDLLRPLALPWPGGER